MHLYKGLLVFGAACLTSIAQTAPSRRANSPYVGYLISTFSDANPSVQWWLSNGNDPSSYTFLNGGRPILKSTVGTRGVRDLFLTSNSARTRWYLIATDLDINIEGFSWDRVTRTGSLGLVIWSSTDLVEWSSAKLVTVEAETAGMAWAPSAVYDDENDQFYVFWSSRQFDPSDPDHTGEPATLDSIRYATTSDFESFSEPQDYIALENTPLIDQEFQYLGQNGHWVRFLKDESVSKIYQETTTGGLFGRWTRVGDWVTNDNPREGPACFADNEEEGVYHLLLDDYTQYVHYQTDDILEGRWTASDYSNFPRGLKHGSVTPLTQEEYDAVAERYGGGRESG